MHFANAESQNAETGSSKSSVYKRSLFGWSIKVLLQMLRSFFTIHEIMKLASDEKRNNGASYASMAVMFFRWFDKIQDENDKNQKRKMKVQRCCNGRTNVNLREVHNILSQNINMRQKAW